MPYPIIDARLGVERLYGNVALWREGVATLIEELPSAMADMECAHTEQRLDDLRFKAHYLFGTALYCGMPMLEVALKSVEHACVDAPDQVGTRVVSLKIAVTTAIDFVEVHGIPEV